MTGLGQGRPTPFSLSRHQSDAFADVVTTMPSCPLTYVQQADNRPTRRDASTYCSLNLLPLRLRRDQSFTVPVPVGHLRPETGSRPEDEDAAIAGVAVLPSDLNRDVQAVKPPLSASCGVIYLFLVERPSSSASGGEFPESRGHGRVREDERTKACGHACVNRPSGLQEDRIRLKTGGWGHKDAEKAPGRNEGTKEPTCCGEHLADGHV